MTCVVVVLLEPRRPSAVDFAAEPERSRRMTTRYLTARTRCINSEQCGSATPSSSPAMA